MNVFLVEYWSRVDCEWKNEKYLAKDEDQLVKFMNDNVLAPEFRQKSEEDTLRINTLEENVTIPCFIGDY